jgi:hypothetical protein
MDRDHIFGIESVCDRQVSEIIDIFYGDTETKEDRILTSQEFTKLAQRQVIKCLLESLPLVFIIHLQNLEILNHIIQFYEKFICYHFVY